jgi:hypothetical protein
MAIAPFPIPAHRTGRAALPHPALRLVSPRGTRRCSYWQAFEAQESTFSIDDFTGEPFGPAPCHFVPSGEEVAHALVDVSVNATECRSARPVAEVVRPTKQRSDLPQGGGYSAARLAERVAAWSGTPSPRLNNWNPGAGGGSRRLRLRERIRARVSETLRDFAR